MTKPRSRSRRALISLVAGAVLLALPSPASAEPPAGDISKNVKFIANIPEMKSAIALAFIKDTMFVSTVHGIYSYDVSDPATPKLLGSVPMYIWENEDMTIDVKRNLLFVSRDPRGFTTPVSPGSAFPYGAVHIISVKDPSAMLQLNVIPVPAGHTTTCINKCQYIWTSGPGASTTTQSEWDGRPIFATDVSNPHEPVSCPDPIDTQRNDGVTDYVHDLQVDAKGIAWVSGAGGVRGYWTSGTHKDPLTGKSRQATGCNPIPYAGGGTPTSATPSRFMHNAWRNPKAKVDGRRGDVLYATEEANTTACAQSGRFATFDLKGSYEGQGWKNIDKTQFRMKALDTWTPEKADGATGCDSAHYLSDRGDGLLAYAFYSQGTRFLDVSNPRNIKQVGYYRPDDANTWAPYWHDGYVFVANFDRGVDVLKFGGGGGKAVTAPPLSATGSTADVEFDPDLG
ncbi:MAG TPA: hypothetical protein VEV82_01915, partial [Actinomycetota bacterium]|nr:hypothetical protein [Actinomycetota bacterium]